MEHERHAAHGGVDRGALGDVPFHELDALAEQGLRAVGISHERAHPTPVGPKALRDRVADEAGGAGDEHEIFAHETRE